MIDFLSIVLLIFGVLQIVLFFKVWSMTNNVKKIRNKIEQPPKQKELLIKEAQIKTLNGEPEEAFKLYQKAFYLAVIELYNTTINDFGNEENDYPDRDEYYAKHYSSIVKYYSKRIKK